MIEKVYVRAERLHPFSNFRVNFCKLENFKRMKSNLKTPGVYIQELDAFGNAVVSVPTAVPAFIAYTGQTRYNGEKSGKQSSEGNFVS